MHFWNNLKLFDNPSFLQFLAKRLNAVVFPGGGVNIYSSEYHRMAKIFYDYSLNLMDTKQENFPILGVCLGESFWFCVVVIPSTSDQLKTSFISSSACSKSNASDLYDLGQVTFKQQLQVDHCLATWL